MADSKKSSIAANTIHLLHLKTPERTGKRLKLSFQRTPGMVSIVKSGKRVDISLSLLDISETGVGFFCDQLLLKGSTIELILSEPKVLKLLGLVAWSVPIKSGIHQAKFGFRSGMQFQFENEIQRAALIDFIQKIAIEPAEQFKAQLAAKADAAAKEAALVAAGPAANPDNDFAPPPGVAANASEAPAPAPEATVAPAAPAEAIAAPTAEAPIAASDEMPAIAPGQVTASPADMPAVAAPAAEAVATPAATEETKPTGDGSGENQAA